MPTVGLPYVRLGAQRATVECLLLDWTLSTPYVRLGAHRVTVEDPTDGMYAFKALRWNVSMSTVDWDWVYREPLLNAYCWTVPFQGPTFDWVHTESLLKALLLGWTLSTPYVGL